VLAVLLTLLGWAIVAAVGRQAEQVVALLLHAETERTSQLVGLALAGGTPFDRAATGAVAAPRSPDVWVVIRDAAGQVVARSPGATPAVDAAGAGGAAAVAAGASWWQTTATVPGLGTLALSVAPLRTTTGGGGAAGGSVQVTVPTNLAAGVLRGLTVALTVAFAAAVGLALAGGPPLVRLGLRPLRDLAGVSRRLAGGDLAARAPVPPSRDEVADLARDFNEMAARLEAAFAAQRAFVADASHELRTPLTALNGRLAVVARALDDDPAEARRQVDAMRRDVARMTRLVGDLLQLARLDAAGGEDLLLAPVDLAAVARDVYEQSRALPAAEGRTVRLAAAPPVPVRADAARLHQVLLNLVVNGLQHAPAGGHVDLAVRGVPGEAGAAPGATVVVADDGPGIPPEDLPHLFDRFYRSGADRAGGGAGLGLAIARAIVVAHGGTIRAENAPGGGARFTVALPPAPPAPPAPGATRRAEPGWG
jgi:two-component system OmpR family sensor kinase